MSLPWSAVNCRLSHPALHHDEPHQGSETRALITTAHRRWPPALPVCAFVVTLPLAAAPPRSRPPGAIASCLPPSSPVPPMRCVRRHVGYAGHLLARPRCAFPAQGFPRRPRTASPGRGPVSARRDPARENVFVYPVRPRPCPSSGSSGGAYRCPACAPTHPGGRFHSPTVVDSRPVTARRCLTQGASSAGSGTANGSFVRPRVGWRAARALGRRPASPHRGRLCSSPEWVRVVQGGGAVRGRRFRGVGDRAPYGGSAPFFRCRWFAQRPPGHTGVRESGRSPPAPARPVTLAGR